MKALALILLISSLYSFASTKYTTTISKVATTDTMYSYTYRNETQVCAVDVFVPAKGKIKVEKLCFNK
jgi:hypothetical protein